MSAVGFLQQFMKEPRTVGAVLPSSKYLAQEMIASIDFSKAKCIVEYGPGTGVFTKRLIESKHSETILLILETNAAFCWELKQTYGHIPNVYIINDSAEHVSYYVRQHGFAKADYVISGLPFTSLPADVSTRILEETEKTLSEQGAFMTFQYSKVKSIFFKSFFEQIKVKRVWQNVPPAYVFTCKKGLNI
ncbi:class I SAM-dependent methyltransferase [Ectobacillus antri]|jgi:phospholipid N-methyltransferase|uniref:class I SAM-dependent methyltransferase n=1 Tax=Ectobacillus antri TaxID=2486280 RepID=UPI000F5B113A|nr:rRNA adenine N-6-methyltransferase family protein [Ectobacillus antri]